ncbi:DUF2490 domain-containing protein [Algoriphagus litoralis]|uniref:DUF2490 domain-containing protein n=1 Tax=Algoriphagus litoralis TaxID=2202829 RepID=UPI000DB9B942|nr:DUF2490 domain-containing protein [Algoriphagus litoralis]
MKSNIKFSLLFSVFTLLIAQESFAQYKTRLWNSLSVGAPLTENLSIKASYMKSLDLSSPQLETSFNWYSLKLGYQIDKDWSVDFGTAWMNLPGSGRTTNRIFAEGNHRIKLNKKFSLRNSLQVERHNDQEERFDYRFILSSRIGLRKRLDFLKVAPSLSYSLFYNIGGAPVRYFNEQGEEIARDAANGFHRGRILANFNFKVSDPIRLSVYYMNQHEFNLVLSETNKINVTNPNTGRVQRPFNNQHIIGISLSYQFKGLDGDGFLPINF